MQTADRQLLHAMMREMDELTVELQLEVEIKDRIRRAQVPPVPYDQTPEYLEEQRAVEELLAQARTERQKARHDGDTREGVRVECDRAFRMENQPHIEDLAAARKEILALEEEVRVRERYQAELAGPSVGGGSAVAASAPLAQRPASADVTMLRGALALGRRRQTDLEHLRHTVQQQNAEIAARASRHARQLEEARAAAAAAEGYERQFQAMRARLRHDVLVEAFGIDVFEPLEPVRVPCADLFLEFEYTDDRDFGILTQPGVTLDTLAQHYQQLPHIWEFFINRCSSAFSSADDDLSPRRSAQPAPPITSPSAAAGSSAAPPSAALPEAPAMAGATDDDDDHDSGALGSEPPSISTSGGALGPTRATTSDERSSLEPPSSSSSVCRQALGEVRGLLRDLEDEQRQHEELIQFRAQRAATLREGLVRRRGDTPPSATMSALPEDSEAAFGSTVPYMAMNSSFLAPVGDNNAALTLTAVNGEIHSAPVTFAVPNAAVIQRALGDEAARALLYRQQHPLQGSEDIAALAGVSHTENVSSAATRRKSGVLSYAVSRRSLKSILRVNPQFDSDAAATTSHAKDPSRSGESVMESSSAGQCLEEATDNSTSVLFVKSVVTDPPAVQGKDRFVTFVAQSA